mmetsp:Transcript_6029/g.10158  ORF Transcript_6029/g.10158 Transcript_6029/m.10158 type:complete len:87 (+) Transcript_6029:364-624(+)
MTRGTSTHTFASSFNFQLISLGNTQQIGAYLCWSCKLTAIPANPVNVDHVFCVVVVIVVMIVVVTEMPGKLAFTLNTNAPLHRTAQ